MESAGTDAFTFAWTGEHAYLAPQVSKILLAAKKIALTSMTAVLIIPCWPGCRFWPHLFPDGRHAAQMVLHIQLIRTRMRRPPEGSSVFSAFVQEFIILYIKGGILHPWKVRVVPSLCMMRLRGGLCYC